MLSREVLAVIPARSGSKSIPHKNICAVAGKPLLAWTIEHAAASKRITRIIVSTDSPEYAQIARQHGGETPFLRPIALAQDDTPDLPVFRHALQWLQENECYLPDACVHLRPTCPIRDPKMIDEMVDILFADPTLDSVRTVTPVLHPPYKMWWQNAAGILSPVGRELKDVPEPWNAPRQSLPPTYLQTANIDVVRTNVITEKNSMTGDRIRGYVEQDFLDIDCQSELDDARVKLEQPPQLEGLLAGRLTDPRFFCFDIDGVIATLSPGNDYHLARPCQRIIQIVNALHNAGHHITLFTARGSATGIDWKGVTESQLRDWVVKYHVLRFGKPPADFYIDDRMLSLNDLNRLGEAARRLSHGTCNRKECEPERAIG